jgi:Flp pilus assembly protein TadG
MPYKEISSEKGQSMTELAVSIVILLVLVAGIVDLGRMFFAYIGMRDAAQEGVVFGITEPTQCEQIADRATSVLSDPDGVQVAVTMNGVDCGSATVSDTCSGKGLLVTVTDPDFALSMPFLGAILGRQSIYLEAKVSGTILRPQCP